MRYRNAVAEIAHSVYYSSLSRFHVCIVQSLLPVVIFVDAVVQVSPEMEAIKGGTDGSQDAFLSTNFLFTDHYNFKILQLLHWSKLELSLLTGQPVLLWFQSDTRRLLTLSGTILHCLRACQPNQPF